MSMWARRVGTVKASFTPELVAVSEVTCGEDASDGLQIFIRNSQDDTPRCGLAPQRKSASRSFRCRVATGECESPSAV